MLRHAEAAAEFGIPVVILGFRGERLPEARAGVTTLTIPAFDVVRSGARALRIVAAAARQTLLMLGLAARLLMMKRPTRILLQTPPLLPAAPLLVLYAFLVRARLILDWHNSTAAMFEKRFGRTALLGLVTALERHAARATHWHLAVSARMAAVVSTDAIVLRDRAPARFAPGLRTRRAGEPVVFVAPSSFSLDDDFELLEAALRECDARMAPKTRAIVVLTGYGERREEVMAAMMCLELTSFTISNAWLSEAALIALLQSADAGISLHRSPSGLDLPIKIAEIVACGTVMLALDAGGAMEELDVPVMRFGSSGELASMMLRVIDGLAAPPRCDAPSWSEEWARTALPMMR
jgi:beta-1,4-mannosyltransferase